MEETPPPLPAPFPVIVHPFNSPTRHSCAYESGDSSSKNAVIFVGGLGGGPHTTDYVRTVSKRLEDTPSLNYSIFEIRMTSSFNGFGTSSLKQDVLDLSALVDYLRGLGRKKIVLFGHSTGSQDCAEYADYGKYKNAPVDGFILQGGVSDREGIPTLEPPVSPEHVTECLELAERMISEGNGDDCLPMSKIGAIYWTPVSAYRFKSLVSKGGDDDLFSSDMSQEEMSAVWGRFKKPVLVLHSAEDEYVPPHVNTADLLAKWKGMSSYISSLSEPIPGGSHSVKAEPAREWLADQVVRFLQEV